MWYVDVEPLCQHLQLKQMRILRTPLENIENIACNTLRDNHKLTLFLLVVTFVDADNLCKHLDIDQD